MRDKFKDAEDEADAISTQGEEQWIRLRQNGGSQLNELDSLYLDLAGHVIEFNTEKDKAESMWRTRSVTLPMPTLLQLCRLRKKGMMQVLQLQLLWKQKQQRQAAAGVINLIGSKMSLRWI